MNMVMSPSDTPVIISLMSSTAYVTGLNFARVDSHSGSNSSGNSAGLIIKSGIPSILIMPQKVSCDLAVAATVTDTPANPSENNMTMPIIGIIIMGSEKVTPIASAIPIMRLACSAATSDMAAILPSAIDAREMGVVRTMFIKPYRLSHNVLTPPNILVNIAVNTMTPGAMNSIYSPSNPTDSMSGCVPANVFPTTIIHIAGWINLMSTPLFDFLYRFASLQNIVYASYIADLNDDTGLSVCNDAVATATDDDDSDGNEACRCDESVCLF